MPELTNKGNPIVPFLVGILLLLAHSALAQNQKCGTAELLNHEINKNPGIKQKRQEAENATQNWINANRALLLKKGNAIITIPVVVHILYRVSFQNISDAQVKSQIDALNRDFRGMNADSLKYNHPFWEMKGDSKIEFCLASVDPDGNATNGITRTYTDSISFKGYGSEKNPATGGKQNWDPTSYLNIWVCNLQHYGGLLGYSTIPYLLQEKPEEDGVVIHFRNFGTLPPLNASYNLGRTVTHEVGHWLQLDHIWGDAECGDDYVDDTKIAKMANYACPKFPHNANSICGSDNDGEMFMNYMDYTNDSCMNMFTKGQTLRMIATLNILRPGILSSNGCDGNGGIRTDSRANSFSIYPNPGNVLLTIGSSLVNTKDVSIEVFNPVGVCIKTYKDIKTLPFQLDMRDWAESIYFIKIKSGQNTITYRILKAE